MHDVLTGWKAAISALVAALTAFWGWFGWLAAGWIFLMALDYITGTAAACKAGQWSSKAARDGIWHKCGEIVVVLVAGLADLLLGLLLDNMPAVPLPTQVRGIVCVLVLAWYILTELGSIAENAVRLGANVPAWLSRWLNTGKSVVDAAGEQIIRKDTEEQDRRAP